ncbi:MAG TPA: ABC transporter ATP-binding protein/permease [Rhizomicrobium sp.]
MKLRVVAAIACLMLASVASAVAPLLIADLTDALARDDKLSVGIWLLAGFLGARLVAQVLPQLRDVLFLEAQYDAVREMGRFAMAHLHGLSLRYHLERRIGGLVRTIELGMRAINTLLSYGAVNTIPVLLQLVFFTIEIVWKLGIGIAIAVLATVAVYVWFTVVVTQRQAQIRRAVNARDTEAAAVMVDSLINSETVKHFSGKDHETRRFGGEMANFAGAMVEAEKTIAFLNIGQATIMGIGMGVVMVLTAIGIHDGVYSIGDFVLGNAILMQLYQPLTALGTVYHELVQSFADLEAMFALLDRTPEVTDAPGAKDLAVTDGEIRFEHVSFAYEDGSPILKDISFRVPPGKTVAIVGPSGSGKSTIARILNRFYDVKDGLVTIDGQDIGAVTQASLRAAIAVVPQDAGMFNDTISYNIAYGRPGASRSEIVAASRAAQLDDFICSLPQGYDTLVGERGLKLSGGEKQRLAIARAILKDAPIFLMDEATSALDTHTERGVQAALATASRRRTTLIIAHRLSTVVDADELLVLERGMIVERGTHAALLARRGAYAILWARQREADVARAAQ